MKKKSRVGRQMYNVLFFAFIIPIAIIGIMSVFILYREMKDRYEAQIKAENTRIKSIMFDITSSVYTNLETIMSSQDYRDMFTSSHFARQEQEQYISLTRAIGSLRGTTAAISSINIYTNNPVIPTGNNIVNVGKSGEEKLGDDAKLAAGSGNAGDPFSRFEWYEQIDTMAWNSYTCSHVPLNDYEDAYELTLVRRFNTGSSENKAYMVVTVSTNYLRNRLINNDEYMLICLSGYPVFFSSQYGETEIEMPEISEEGPDKYNFLGDMMLGDGLALTYISSFAPYKVDSRFFVLVGDYEAHDQINAILREFMVILLLTLMTPIVIVIMYSRFFTKRVNALRQAMHRASVGDYDIIEDVTGDDELSDTFNDLKLTTEKIRENEGRYYEQRIREQELINMQQNMEFKMLSGQINPHFLYNTLEAIRMQAIRGGDRDVATSVKYLAKIMHYVLESTGKTTATLADELKHVESYLQIQRLRFGEKVSWNFYIDGEFDPEKYHILPLLLQPIVENAITHGLKDMDRNGHVSIIVEYDMKNRNSMEDESGLKLSETTDKRKLLITINDDGKGMTQEEVERLNASLSEKRVEGDEKAAQSIGLYNIHQRIKLVCGDEYGMTIRAQEGKGTSVELRLPGDGLSIEKMNTLVVEEKKDERQE
ncbi:sensor histidine kinase [Butyrivibrio sp. NC2002]|uniref:sensor histidine kinase n=1 Tax=Butyrivibrio sp. NC2002 TaxID=1410610 RepID=UPI00055E486E|nr:histidine kinase [Butyrivibrio sp. NC2002]